MSSMLIPSDKQLALPGPFPDAGQNGTGSRTPLNGSLVSSAPLPVYHGEFPSGCWWELHQGDCRVALQKLPAASVHCVVTSPPYYWQRDYGVEGQIGHEATIDGYVEAIVGCFRQVWRVLADDGVVFLNLGDTYYSAKGKPHGTDKKHQGRQLARRTLRAVDGSGLGLPRKSLIGIPWRVALAMQKENWTLRSDVVWKRPGALPEPTAHDRPWSTHEHVFIFSKKPRYWFNRKAVGDEEDIWYISPRPDNPGAHFAPFPSALVEKCLLCGCRPGGTVLDPFVGSGTTLAVAGEMERNAIGVELSPEYCQYVVSRLGRPAVNGKSRLGTQGWKTSKAKVV
jgi:DNA modification methylase